MARPGKSVKAPVTINAKTNRLSIVQRCAVIRPRRACRTPKIRLITYESGIKVIANERDGEYQGIAAGDFYLIRSALTERPV